MRKNYKKFFVLFNNYCYNYVNEMVLSFLMFCDYEVVNFYFSFILKYKFILIWIWSFVFFILYFKL